MTQPLTILIITQEDPFYIPCFFKSFMRIFSDHPGEIVLEEVIIQPSFGESKLELARRLLGFYGGVDFTRLMVRYALQRGVIALERLQPSREPTSIAAICGQKHIPVRTEADVNSRGFVQRIQSAGIDLVVSVSAPQIFREALITAPRLGCINIHNGRLPDYRGMLPNFWQMLNGESHSTTTVHTMVRKLDAGEVLWEQQTPILPHTTLDGLIRETKAKSAEALWHVLDILARGEKPAVTREIKGEGTYYTFPRSEQANALRQKGHALL